MSARKRGDRRDREEKKKEERRVFPGRLLEDGSRGGGSETEAK